MSVWHKLEHKLGWFRGHVVSRTDEQGRIFIGFMCSRCGLLTSEHDASAIIDRHIEAHLAHRARW